MKKVNNFNLMPLSNLIFLHENAGVEFYINDGMIVDSGTKKDSPAGGMSWTVKLVDMPIIA